MTTFRCGGTWTEIVLAQLLEFFLDAIDLGLRGGERDLLEAIGDDRLERIGGKLRRNIPGVEPRDGSLLAPSVEPSANVQNSVVGAGARVGEGVTLQRCVVWPGTTVTESATNAVITPSHRIDVN